MTETSVAEVVHESPATRVTRFRLAGRPVVRKEPRGADAGRRLRSEETILRRLRGEPGIAQLIDGPHDPAAILMEDAGTRNLAGRGEPLATVALVEIAVRLARAVAAMHARGVIHRDICPANIVVSDDGAPCLVDFSLATTFAEIRPEFAHHTEILGTLAYLAPEQTGRTGRSVDQRADLYALGATLYELSTGEPPFGSADPLRLIHDHLARAPVPPAEANAAVPAALSAIVMHLLEKEPDDRYQTADGVVHDLERLRAADGDLAAAAITVGERDVPLMLLAPSRLVGREHEVAALRSAFEEALAGRCRAVLIGGAPGVGKTVLADELRPVVARRGGWFAAGKFDQYRRDLEFDAVHQALRALGRLLLAEGDDELGAVRTRILEASGMNAGLLSAASPELSALLGVPADPGDPLTAQPRAARAAFEMVRAVASPQRPLVLFVDDLQWAGRTPLGFVDLVLGDEPVEGLLLVGAYRDVGEAQTLAAFVARWRAQPGVQHLKLENLSPPGLGAMVVETLRTDAADAHELVDVIASRTRGNPYETVELLNAMRRDGLLLATGEGWRWDSAAVRRRFDESHTSRLLAARMQALTPAARELVESMACLGGSAELTVLQVATAVSARALDERLAAARDEGLLVTTSGAHPTVRFRHDRIREVVLDGVEPERRRVLQLTMARRLAEAPELFAVAAEQYLPVVAAVQDAVERRRAVGVLRRAAAQATLIGDHALVDSLLAAALRLIEPDDRSALVATHTGRHAALYSLGRLEEADDEYRAILELSRDPAERADATVVQLRSLTNRSDRLDEAFEMGIASLHEAGIAVPGADRLRSAVDRHFRHLYRWLDTDPGDDLARPEISDSDLLAAIALFNPMVATAYFAGKHGTVSWLGLEAVRIWLDEGAARTLLGPLSHAAWAAVVRRGDYAAGYQTMVRMLAVGEDRGYEPDTSQVRFHHSIMAPWFEPLEDCVESARRARAGLVAGGDLANAGYCYYTAAGPMLDSAAALEASVAEVERGLAFTRRTGNEQGAAALDTYRWLLDVLRGPRAPDVDAAASIDAVSPGLLGDVNRAIAAAIFGDLPALSRHTAAVMPLVDGEVLYATGQARVLRGIALAMQARASDGQARRDLMSELDELMPWLVARATDAPDNFLHLLRLVEGERAWTNGDFQAAVLAFAAARHAAGLRPRPWHRALITERFARFYLAHGVDELGQELLWRARQAYEAWGARAKVAQLDWAHPTLRLDAEDAPARVTTGTIDLLGIVSASQALSSETSVEGVHARVSRVLGEMTGATAVRLALRSEDGHDWQLRAPGGDGPTGTAGPSGDAPAMPMSVLRYVQRTGEPLTVDDAASDDRFGGDPYFAGVETCSLLALPVFARGALRAVLVLENRLLRGAFTAERLETVKLIAGQLAVSLDNAQLYAEHRRIAQEQAALRRVATLVAQGAAPSAVFDAVAAEIEQLLEADGVALARYGPGGELGVVAQRGASAPRPPTSAGEDPDARVVETPIVVEGRPWGVSSARLRHPPPADTRERIAQFAALLETAIANAESRDQLAASRARLVTEADDARRRVVRDLHDGAQQRLVHTVISLELAQRSLERGDGRAAAFVAEALDQAQHGNAELRELAHGILPASLTRDGLPGGIEAVVERLNLPVEVDVPDERLPADVEASVYFVVAEALTNVMKHARARTAGVTVVVRDGMLRVEVRDDGAGGADAGGHGLVGMKDRVTALGGQFAVDSPPGGGTLVSATVPIAGV